MTPAARIAAAIEILDAMADGLAAEPALIRWARASRYAGSKDRAAVRDHVFDVLRQRETAACLGGGTSGRALMAGLLQARGEACSAYFTGEGHAPKALTTEEISVFGAEAACRAAWNLPTWLIPHFEASLGTRAADIAHMLQQRAPTCLRVNTARITPDEARQKLASEGIETETNALAGTALTVTAGARRVRLSKSYETGLVELQDAASQAVVLALPKAARCLDFCAGGGGKALALAALGARAIHAHDKDPRRMRDLATRAARAGCTISQIDTAELAHHAPYDLVLCDVPCSGSGAWRRSPEAKWQFQPDRLDALCAIQDKILQHAATLIGEEGTVAYVTCSVLRAENEDRVAAFLEANPGWTCGFQRRLDVSEQGDGFFTAHLTQRK